MENADIKSIIRKLQLKPHPEGGWFRETYRSEEVITQSQLHNEYGGDRNISTCIYFLLGSENHSNFHKIKQDEIWHFYKGAPIELHLLTESREYEKVLIGNDIAAGHLPQYIVPGGCWFAANVLKGGEYGLVGCTVAPGFDFDDFVLANRKQLLEKYPEYQEVIIRFTAGV